MKFLKSFHNYFNNNSNVRVVNSNHTKISDNNVINGTFKVFNLKHDMKILDDISKSTNAKVQANKKFNVEDNRLYNESRTGYANPVTHTVNMHNSNAYNI